MEKMKTKFGVIAVISIILFAFAISPVTLQNDTFYTIKIGEYILENGISVGQDPFSWHENLEYTFPHWAYDVFIHLVHNLCGQVGVYLSTCLLTAILGLMIFFVHSKVNKNQLISFFLTIAAMYLLRDFIAARAQLITFILFVLTIFLVERFMETKKKRYAAGLIIIPIIVANIHLAVWPFYFVLLLPYIGDYIFNNYIMYLDVFYLKFKIRNKKKKLSKIKDDEELEQELNVKISNLEEKLEAKIANKDMENKFFDKVTFKKNNNGKWLILIAVICLFTGLLTPLGDTPYTYLIKTGQGNTTDNISEHLPLTIAQNKEFALVFVLTVLLGIFTRFKLSVKDWLMIGGLITLAFMSRRQASMVYLIGLIFIAKIIVELINKYDPNGTADMMKALTTKVGMALTISVVVLISLLMAKPKTDDKFVAENAYPIEASTYILENIDIDRMKIFNEYNYGSYLLFKGIPVFIDSRADLYTPEFNEGVNIFNDFLNITGLSEPYEAKFEEYGITHVILYKTSKLNLLLEKDSNYNVIYTDKYFRIYERLSANVEQVETNETE